MRMLLVAVLVGCANRALAEPLRPAWLKQDDRVVRSVLPLVREPPRDLAQSCQRYRLGCEPLGARSGADDQDLGLGYRRASFRRPGGYLQSELAVIHDRAGRIVYGELTVSGDAAAWSVASKRYDAGSLPGVRRLELPGYAGLAFAFEDPEAVAVFEASFRAHFAAPPPPALPPELANDFRQLTVPLRREPYGMRVGEAGAIPAPRIAAEHLAALGRTDLLEAIATSPSAEGRLYAIELLLRAGPAASVASGPRAQLLSRIAALGAEAEACFGCSCFSPRLSTAAQILDLIRHMSGAGGAADRE
jgi:hypothetical protein